MEQEYIQDFSREELLYESRLETAMEKGIIEGKRNVAKEMLKNHKFNFRRNIKMYRINYRRVDKDKIRDLRTIKKRRKSFLFL